LSLLLLAAVVGGYFYLQNLVNRGTDELAGLVLQSVKTKTEEQKQLEVRVAAARRKLADFSVIAASWKSGTAFFDGLENMTSGGVYFSKCDLDFAKMTASLTGYGNNFQDVGRQAAKFESAAGVLESADFGKIATSENGGIDFDAQLVLKPEMVVVK
jgi:hypothetical protein